MVGLQKMRKISEIHYLFFYIQLQKHSKSGAKHTLSSKTHMLES